MNDCNCGHDVNAPDCKVEGCEGHDDWCLVNNAPCVTCGRKDLPLHYNGECVECFDVHRNV